MLPVDRYREKGMETYGDKCELCSHGMVEVHHIDYKLHGEWEVKIRKAPKDQKPKLIEEAKKHGFEHWDGHDLSKDSRTKNLSVLCPNCHTLIHRIDASVNLLKALPPRK